MKTIIEMAREAGLCNEQSGIEGDGGCLYDYAEEIKRFAELIRADEQKKWEEQTAVEIHEAILEEREACAKVVLEMKGQCWAYDHDTIAAAIRARGNV